MKFLLSIALMLMASVTANAQVADDIIGNWKNGEGTGIIQIYKTTSGHYAGKIIWLKEPNDPVTKAPKLDENNSDEKLKKIPILGLVNMKGFSFDANSKKWTGGSIYDPKKGKTYKCKCTLTSKNTLDVRGFIGISLLGRTDTWTRQ